MFDDRVVVVRVTVVVVVRIVVRDLVLRVALAECVGVVDDADAAGRLLPPQPPITMASVKKPAQHATARRAAVSATSTALGCWGMAVAMLTPAGQPEPLFAARIQRFWGTLRFNAFVGDVHVDSTGFTLVGTGQGPCAAGPAFSAPSATGVMA